MECHLESRWGCVGHDLLVLPLVDDGLLPAMRAAATQSSLST